MTTVRHLDIRPSVLYVGTPVMLIGTVNPDGTPNLAPASSYWALGWMLVLGLENDGQTQRNVRERPELTVNFPSPALWSAVEAIADTTGRVDVPPAKAARYRHVADKFAAAGLTPQASQHVAPPRVEECALQLEARVARITDGLGDYAIVEAEVQAVHADPRIVAPGTDHIDPRLWEPTIYSFRHYFGIGGEHGHRPTSDTAGAGA
ncbi:flavin reductase family protein [Microbacterium barkeri]|uniref:flavin reductase family protein n=1 Tax=Microbacterium barkeri TaxID=33917 RepID=UPI0024AF2B34|nr:flavin reductase family protein [Microbacterium barkeri]MDI6941897.1 flavin reductase family protein [Microbacterium barkeri]